MATTTRHRDGTRHREGGRRHGARRPSAVDAEGTDSGPTVAARLEPLVEALLGTDRPVRIEGWDGSATGPADAAGVLRLRSDRALRRLCWAPGELGLARAYVAGDLDLDGDIFEVLSVLRDCAPERDARFAARALPATVRVLRSLGGIGGPPPPPMEEHRAAWGRRHSKARDADVVGHHYDVGNDFYRLVLGPSMTYSCARFDGEGTTLEAAQAAKHALVCAKLGLPDRPGARLLDVGCGWGSLALHAAREHGATVVGITISAEQARWARQRVHEAGLIDRVEIRFQDYRDLRGERFDAVASIGMFEHVGQDRMAEYFAALVALLRPEGRLLNHAISSAGDSRLGARSFMGRYVFPDGELLDVGRVVLAMEQAGLEVRDVESLREHYARTLHHWVANLEAGWEEAVALVGERRARVWRLYMAASALGFADGGIGIHQVLGVKAHHGHSGMPPTRRGWP